MRRPKYLQLEDEIQDHIESHGKDGLTILQISAALNVSYAATQRALSALRLKRRVSLEVRTRVHHYFPT